MKLKCKELQELYDRIMSGSFTFDPSGENPIDKIFEECDEKLDDHISYNYLRELQDRMDIIEKSNVKLLWANGELISEKNKLKDEIKQLKVELDATKSACDYFEHSRNDWWNRAKRVKADYEESCKTVQELSIENKRLSEEILEVKKALDNAKSSSEYFEHERDLWRDGAKNWEEKLKLIDAENTSEREKLKADNNELKKQIDDLTASVRRHKINVGKESIHLWHILQNLRDITPEEFDPKCKRVGDILDMDLEDFLDSYEKWQMKSQKKNLIHMRNYLSDFCNGRDCIGCPFESDDYKCGNGYFFNVKYGNGNRLIPDEEIKEYYDKARCYLRSFRKDQSCTLNATIELNKDQIEKLFGIDL